MNNFFNYDENTGYLTLNVPEIIAIREFEALMDKDRNKCKEDPTGLKKLRAFREFKYIYLAIHWSSPYADYYNRDKHEEALKDSLLTEEEWNNPEFRAACRKFKELQESNRSIKMLDAARITVDRFIEYFKQIDPMERDELTGKPVYKVKDVQAELTNLNKVHESLVLLEAQVKKEIAETSNLRGNVTDGFLPMDF